MSVTINYQLCEATGVCEQVCPEDVFMHTEGVTKVIQPSACTQCWICVDNCVAGAIEID